MKRKPPTRTSSVSLRGQLLMCAHCGCGFESQQAANGGGRPALYCTNACRLRAWRARRR